MKKVDYNIIIGCLIISLGFILQSGSIIIMGILWMISYTIWKRNR
ncbi:hypothetical protein RI065_11660 [Mycoplasmatota bacterium zrk1]